MRRVAFIGAVCLAAISALANGVRLTNNQEAATIFNSDPLTLSQLELVTKDLTPAQTEAAAKEAANIVALATAKVAPAKVEANADGRAKTVAQLVADAPKALEEVLKSDAP